jgi:RHS repeat-associated protein
MREEYAQFFNKAKQIVPLGDEAFGEDYDPYSGSTMFKATDVILPGTGSVPVELRRMFRVDASRYIGLKEQFGSWEIDLPYLYGIFADAPGGGWNIGAGARCSAPTSAFNVAPSALGFSAREFWHGNFLHSPDQGDVEIVFATSDARMPRPSDSSYKYVTKNYWFFSCLPSVKNGTGEGFLAVSPLGTKYYFDWMTEYPTIGVTRPGQYPNTTILLKRKEVRIYPTRIEDRFGNWVIYEWQGQNLNRILAKDGRQILLSHGSDGKVDSATVGSRNWSYYYGIYRSGLEKVTNPDLSGWRYQVGALQGFSFYDNSTTTRYNVGWCEGSSCVNRYVMDELMICSWMRKRIVMGSNMVVTAPSGAVGTFVFQPIRRGRNGVPSDCMDASSDFHDSYASYNFYPVFFDNLGLVSKTVNNLGQAATWTYAYSSPEGSYSGPPAPGSSYGTQTGTSSTTIHSPDGASRTLIFGNRYESDEGLLLDEQISGAGGSRAITRTYYDEAVRGPAPFARLVGNSGQQIAGNFGSRLIPVVSTSVAQDGVTFSNTVSNTANGFDAFARPRIVEKSSSLGSRTDATDYYDDLTKWVLGQIKSVTCTAPASCAGLVMAQTDYHPITALPVASYSFGKLESTLAYYADGTLRQVTDGRGYTTTLSGWNRGIPQLIQYPATAESTAGATESAVVNSSTGWIDSTTDENGYTTCYTYDPMGRLATITYPSEAVLNTCGIATWNMTTLNFSPVATGEYGIPAGHWKQTVSTGNARNVTYFDALWRPLVQENYDTANAAGTRSLRVTRYDLGGHPAYQSYPLSTLSNYATITQGTRTTYDALDRVTGVEQDSELGVLASTTAYQAGFKTLVTNPRGYQTITSYMAFDQPTTDWPLTIIHPEGAITNITRDIFGKPLTLARHNADNSSWMRHYFTYDSSQQLCKQTEVETGTTFMEYDPAGNLAWSSAGLPWSPAASCDTDRASAYASSRRVDRTYDARNRIKTLSFSNGFGNQAWSYLADGLPDQVTTYNGANNTVPVVNTYSYNTRRLLTGESVEQAGWYAWSLGYAYDANATLASHTYPAGLSVAYAPNALGQPTKAGTFATGVSYFPNGAIKQFSYGNGIVHTLAQNTRQMPDRSVDAYGTDPAVLDDSYDFDQNGNVVAISDGLTGNRGHRTMTYDGLDRLLTTISPMYGVAGTTYSYDVLDNLKTVKALGRDHTYVYANNRLTNVTNTVGGASVIGLGYDVQGNLANKNGQLYAFDFGNRLRTVTNLESYRYDALGRRVLAWSPTLGNILSQYGQDGVLRYQQDFRAGKVFNHIYLGGSLVATVENPIGTAAFTTKYQHTDALGSPVAVTSSTRAVLERMEYEPFGKGIFGGPGTATAKNGPGYTGHVLDVATGMNYMQQRYYDPSIGRFLSVDPVTADGNTGGNFNRYWYANNNPYRFTDPDGRDPGDLTTWPVPGHGQINEADKPREGDGHFGAPRITSRGPSTHTGIDVKAPVGSKVVAAGDGKVVNQQPNPSKTYGNQVVINHGDGVYTQSAHLDSTTVKPGDAVKAGDEIGTVGRTGNTPKAGDSHLHFEVRMNSPAPRSAGGTVVDPLKQLPPPPPHDKKL